MAKKAQIRPIPNALVSVCPRESPNRSRGGQILTNGAGYAKMPLYAAPWREPLLGGCGSITACEHGITGLNRGREQAAADKTGIAGSSHPPMLICMHSIDNRAERDWVSSGRAAGSLR